MNILGTIWKGTLGTTGGALAWFLANVSTIGAVVGVIVAILSAVSVSLDIWKKWKHRGD